MAIIYYYDFHDYIQSQWTTIAITMTNDHWPQIMWKTFLDLNCVKVAAPFPQTVEEVHMSSCLGQSGVQEWAHTKEGKIIHKVNFISNWFYPKILLPSWENFDYGRYKNKTLI